MATDLTIIVTALSAPIATLLATHLSARAQLRKAELEHRIQLDVDIRRRNSEAHVEYATAALNKVEQAHALLAKLASETSRTSSYIAWSRDMTRSAYHEHYLSLRIDHHSLRAFASTWFPQVCCDVAALGGVMNLYWGRQQHLLYLNEKYGTPKTLEEEKETIEALNEIGRAEQEAIECVFRTDLGVGSGVTWAPIPAASGQAFRSTWAPIPEHLGKDSGGTWAAG